VVNIERENCDSRDNTLLRKRKQWLVLVTAM